MDKKFNSNPYNPTNKLLTETDVIHIMKTLNMNDFTIHNLKYYQTAFIHKSYCHMKDYEKYENTGDALPLQDISYETLEFLGDSFLGCIMSNYLYNRYQVIYDMNEGFLTKMKNRLVNGETLAKLSSELKFNKYLVISNHIEKKCDGRNNLNILEDVFEALLGAIYMDHGDFKMLEDILIYVYETYIDFTDIIINDTNYKDQLLRYFQNNYKLYPKYTMTYSEETKQFKCDVYKGDELVASEYGKTKKKSEQFAARSTLIKYGVLNK